ncbi:MAG: preA [Bacillota bacterium]|jgi:dihydropyrimidine dehydrogenase (NAD+) subunit PreA|nr:preA [Bacillota bacterium]
MAKNADLSIEYLGVKCENPFFLSSSPVGGCYDMVAKAYEAGWGGVFFKTVGRFIADECSPRFDNVSKEDTPWIGFKNMEQISDKPLEDNLQAIHRLKRDYPDKVMVATIMGSTDEEWKELAELVTQAGADLIECNFSCPQMTSHAMGSDVGQNPDLVRQYSKAVSGATKLPVIAKMTPNIGNMEIPAIAAIEGGAKGVSAINTIKSITNINLEHMTAMPVVNGKSAISGYSGAAVKPIGLRFIAQMKSHPLLKDIQMSGIGGIETWRDALEYILVGSHNVQVTTSVMQYGYRIVSDMISGLSYYMQDQGFNKLEDMIGLALPNIIPAEELDRNFKIIVNIDHDKCIGCGRCYVSCFDAAHQAINWDFENRRPSVNDECVGCHLCLNVCPVPDCIRPGEIKYKDESKRIPKDIAFQTRYE